ncbi:hypothetical protein ABZS88_28795 [Streptomyces sp. NPDC005480]|uniref:hypothetical protein n=1 Tax=Streptomyces sp. NPDC005480 TaxID=3154880 RepID=UPI0033AC7814
MKKFKASQHPVAAGPSPSRRPMKLTVTGRLSTGSLDDTVTSRPNIAEVPRASIAHIDHDVGGPMSGWSAEGPNDRCPVRS